jgi:hypothetical protein
VVYHFSKVMESMLVVWKQTEVQVFLNLFGMVVVYISTLSLIVEIPVVHTLIMRLGAILNDM